MLKNVSVTASTIEANAIGDILRNGRSMPGLHTKLKECHVLPNIRVLSVIRLEFAVVPVTERTYNNELEYCSIG